jgi:hypothetical protein
MICSTARRFTVVKSWSLLERQMPSRPRWSDPGWSPIRSWTLTHASTWCFTRDSPTRGCPGRSTGPRLGWRRGWDLPERPGLSAERRKLENRSGPFVVFRSNLDGLWGTTATSDRISCFRVSGETASRCSRQGKRTPSFFRYRPCSDFKLTRHRWEASIFALAARSGGAGLRYCRARRRPDRAAWPCRRCGRRRGPLRTFSPN